VQGFDLAERDVGERHRTQMFVGVPAHRLSPPQPTR
jgi:hypothetical protein